MSLNEKVRRMDSENAFIYHRPVTPPNYEENHRFKVKSETL